MVGNLSEEHRRWILKTYWKYENAEAVRRIQENEFHLPTPSLFTIYHIPDRFETTNSFANELEHGRPRMTLIQDNEMKVALIFVNSRKKSGKLGIPRISLQRLIYQLHLKPY
ncbi:putative mariner [Trichonephila inaurata madagascariensis]|uniref:Putative mariner n=1 Tax=Trichonephila inaurata madagascariensis TaxID=2747483 RepID=A0A8X6YQK4_9ARAC|nr:putative mariner [Trichonephila inaurata madagascariensis]